MELTADPLQHVRAMNSSSAKRYLPWVVATTMFMEQLDSTILNTAVPSAYADIEPGDSSMASSLAGSLQQVSIGLGLAVGSLVAAWYLGDSSQSDRWVAVVSLHHAFLTLGALTILSSLSFWKLHSNDGAIMSMRAQLEDR